MESLTDDDIVEELVGDVLDSGSHSVITLERGLEYPSGAWERLVYVY